jgi:hypothetical protein
MKAPCRYALIRMKYEIEWRAAHRRVLAQAKESKLCLSRSSTGEENDARSSSTGKGKRKTRQDLLQHKRKTNLSEKSDQHRGIMLNN